MARLLVVLLVSVLASAAMAASSTGVEGVEGSAGSVPDLPVGVTLDTSSLYNLWSHALRNQPASRTTFPKIGTLINPHPFRLVNLVPMDGPHPLYSNQNPALRSQFLTDYMVQDKVTPDDPRMNQPGGLKVTNMNGRQLTFTKDSQGKISIEGVGVENTAVLEGGIVTYALEGLLFDHQQRVAEALEKLDWETPHIEPLGGPF